VYAAKAIRHRYNRCVRAILLYNPVAGKARGGRQDEIERVCGVLAAAGFLVRAVATEAAGSAAAQVRAATADGVQYVFVCGGDGTVHDVLQGMVDEARGGGALPVLGVIPMGSANALARHLGLSMSAVEAAGQLVGFEPRLIPVGKIECGGRHRYFTVMAGAGPDGALVYRMMSGGKRRLGRLAYYVRAAGIFCSRRFRGFDLEFVESGSGERGRMRAVSTMVVRIESLGGLFGRLVREGGVHHPHLQVVAVRPPGWISLPVWFVMGWLGVGRWNPLVRCVDVDEFTCTPRGSSRVHVQADGEWIGTAPMRVTMVRDAVRMLMPRD
jgi:diacylglycerol kinase (ATP)